MAEFITHTEFDMHCSHDKEFKELLLSRLDMIDAKLETRLDKVYTNGQSRATWDALKDQERDITEQLGDVENRLRGIERKLYAINGGLAALNIIAWPIVLIVVRGWVG